MPVVTQVSRVASTDLVGRLAICRQNRRLHCSHPYSQSLVNNIRVQSSNGPLVFHSTTQNPYENLALEHYLLTHSHQSSRILFFYTNRPSVIIGRNQNPWSECNLSSLQRGLHGQPIDLVRRRSGGGTVFHDAGNLNFSVIVPNNADFTRRKHAEMVVKAIKAENDMLVASRIFEDVWVNERHDIVMGRQGKVYKVSGSAFKLTRGRALHHGTLLHSSPHLKMISQVLRSAGTSYIQAKGVESVRSPVSNLYDVPEHQRDRLRSAITESVVDQFTRLYGRATEHSIGSPDFMNSDMRNGLEEILTDEWRFGQTPRFDFKSPMTNGQQVAMSVNHGIIEETSIDAVRGQKLAEIRNWPTTKVSELDDLLGKTFPYLATPKGVVNSIHSPVIDQKEQMVTRRLVDGSIEVEQQHNTVEGR